MKEILTTSCLVNFPSLDLCSVYAMYVFGGGILCHLVVSTREKTCAESMKFHTDSNPSSGLNRNP